METINEVDPVKVKRGFLLACAAKDIIRGDLNPDVESAYQSESKRVNDTKESKLNKLIEDKVRLRRYNSMDWYFSEEKLYDMGPWPCMKELSIEFTTGNITETAERFKKTIEKYRGDKSFNFSEYEIEKGRFRTLISQMDSIHKNFNFVYENFPLILFPGGEVRENDYNKRARENNEPLCKIFKYDIDDGNGRALSYALNNIINAKSFVGKRR